MPEQITLFVNVILPIPLPKLYTYRVPVEWNEQVFIGQRVAVPFGARKVYSGIIYSITERPPEGYQATYLIDLLDAAPIVSPQQLQFWEWISTYYMCFLGDVLLTALPAGFRVDSQTQISLHPDFDLDEVPELDSKENEILGILLTQKKVNIDSIQSSLKLKSVLKYVKSLYFKGLISMEEELRENYKPKFNEWAIASSVWENEFEANLALNEMARRSEKQFQAMMLLLGTPGRKLIAKDLAAQKSIGRAVLKSLEKKGFIILQKIQEDRYHALQGEGEDVAFTESQTKAIAEIGDAFKLKKPVILHGVTGSGKTLIYLEFAKRALAEGNQVLFLVPEVALTEHLVIKIAQIIPEEIGVWHHFYSTSERTELYEKIRLREIRFVVGTRNALFAPFKDLSLIIIDEEHESSYKQFEKRPLFHARDAAFQLSRITGANILMGSATPSYEILQRSKEGTVAKVDLFERYEQQQFAELVTLDLSQLKKQNRMVGYFSEPMLEEMKERLEKKEKIIVYHNRKGYAPFIQCSVCGHTTQCSQCDIHLTYYKSSNQQKCNFCGLQQEVPKICVACGSSDFIMKGVGTEKIVEDLNEIFPGKIVARFDQQSIKKRSDFQKILQSFEHGDTDILVGTQLLSKGIDFEKLDLIVVPDSDLMLNIPDFRSHERAFQQLYQLAGRSGRRKKRGKILVQSYQPNHDVFKYVKDESYSELAEKELQQRLEFHYPPFYRLVEVQIRHKDQQTVFAAGQYYSSLISKRLESRMLGPLTPSVARVKDKYIQQFIIKINREKDNPSKIKEYLRWAASQLIQGPGFSSVMVEFDVDPN